MRQHSHPFHKATYVPDQATCCGTDANYVVANQSIMVSKYFRSRHQSKPAIGYAGVECSIQRYGKCQRNSTIGYSYLWWTSYEKNLPLERLYRDSRCGALMLPWTAELCLDMIGKAALYNEGENDDGSTAK